MSYRAIIFDLFGTLVPPFPSTLFEETLTAMAQAVAVESQDFRRLWNQETGYARATGEFASIAANVHAICTALGAKPSPEQVAAAARIRHEFTQGRLHPRLEAVETLQRLRTLGMRHALVSDCSAEVPELWPATSLAALIDIPIFSCTARLKKPDPRIYHLACQGLEVDPQTCLYVGDGASQELTGATRVGMEAVLIAPPDEISAESGKSEGSTWQGKRIQSLAELIPMVTPLAE
jgi:putative hydrolase of the HAD superfamily